MARPPPPLPGSFALRLEECRGRLPPVRGGRHGQKLHSGPPPPRRVDARRNAEAGLS